MYILALAALAACGSAPPAAPAAAPGAPAPGAPPGVPGAPAGVPGGPNGALGGPNGAPGGPAGAPGGPTSPAFFHETSWDAVRARAIGHLAAQERDRARARAMAGDHAGCAARYEAAAAELRALPLVDEAPCRVRDAYAGALARDAAFCAALAAHRDPPVPATPVAALRARAAAARRAGATWDPGSPPVVEVLALSATDPTARAVLRATLTEAWADTVDPTAPTDPWGYWEPADVLRVYAALTTPSAPEPWAISAAELATPPTGDTYVDSAGLPGPRALVPAGVSTTPGPVEEALAATLAAAPPSEVVGKLTAALPELEAARDGGRRARGAEAAVLRRLARAGAYAEAALLARRWRAERPFDRDSINRAGVVRGIEGRLLLLAGDPSAEAVLDEASAATRAFLAKLPAAP